MKKQQKMNIAEQSIAYTLEQSTSPRHSGEGRSRKTSAANPVIDSLDIWSAAQINKKTVGRGNSKKQQAYGINKLRELILELAVRGKLVPQDPDDEPASVLLEKIAEERNYLVKGKKIKKPKKLPAITGEEEPFVLPIGWEYVRLNDLGEWGAGATPSRQHPEYYGGEIPWFKSGELASDYISDSEEHVTKLALEKSSLRYNKVGDVLIAMYGATIGKTSILQVPATTNQAVCACTPFTGFINTYLLLLLKAYKSRFVGMGAGGAQPNISREKLVATVVVLPPTNEQHRIVAKVNELMALCDQLEQQQTDSLTAHQTLVETLLNALVRPEPDEEGAAATTNFEQAWQRITEHFDTLFTTEHSIDQLKQTILQLAVMGKLVPQNPDDEPASELLKKVVAEKAKLVNDGKIKKQKALPPIEEGEQPFILPEGWVWCRLGEIIVIRGGKRVSNGYKLLTMPTPYIYIRVSDMKNGSIDDSDLHYIDSDMRSKIRQYIITKDDLYMTIVGATIGKCGLVPDKFDQMNLTENAARLTPLGEIIKRYLHQLLESVFCQEQFFDKTKQVGVQKMALNRLATTIVPLPPLAEESRIVAKVDELMAICDTLKARLQEAQTTQVHLADAIVEQAVT